MRPGCSARLASGLVAVALLAGCGAKEPARLAGENPVASASADTDAALGTAADSGSAQPGAVVTPALAGRPRELVNPDEATVVFLYHDLSGSTPPLDDWVENDPGVKYGPAAEKAGRRAALKPQLAAGLASVHDVGRIRLSMNANLSEYDPGYGEYTVRALAPSSYVEFKQFGQTVALRFTNGRTAQIWEVPAEQAQAIRDRLGYGNADLDVLVEITGVQPGQGGGSIEGRILEYELREAKGGAALGRVAVEQK